MATSVATWSLRERAVCSRRAGIAGDLGQPPLDRHVDVLVVGVDLEAVALDLGAHLVEALLDRSEVVGADDAAASRASARGRSDCSMSYGARRKSNPIDEFSAWKSGSCGSEKRAMPRRLRTAGVASAPVLGWRRCERW